MTRFSMRRAGRRGHRRADAHRAVVGAPLDVDRRRVRAHQPAVAVDVGREQRHRRRHVASAGRRCTSRTPCDGVPSSLLKMFLPVGLVDHALVHVHRAARLAGDRLGHEGGEHVVAQRRLAHRALEEEHLVGQAQRVGVEEVDLHLPGADLVDQRVDVQLHLLAVVVDVLEQRVELVHGVDRIGLARGLGAAAAADRRLQRHVGVGVARDQVELELGRDHRRPSLRRRTGRRRGAAPSAARRAPACRRWSKQSWITCAVGSVAQGTMRTVLGSGRRCMSRSVGLMTS